MPESKPEQQWESRAERRARKRMERKQGAPTKKSLRPWIWLFVVAVAVGGTWWVIQSNRTPKDPATIANEHQALLDRCIQHTNVSLHIHPHLRIIINGEEQSIPANAGIDDGCMHPVHTHDGSGVIHIESPQPTEFTLADFFSIWDKPYSPTAILDQTVTAESQLKLFANGKEVTTGPDTVVRDKTSYVIMYGPAGTELKPPENYSNFPG